MPFEIESMNTPTSMPLPPLLMALIDAGIWPCDNDAASRQWGQPIVPAERIRAIAPDESQLFLYEPPFHTAMDHLRHHHVNQAEFWERFGRLDQIRADRALIIGDFGLGSDTAIILNYGEHPTDPPVWRLRWSRRRSTEWVQASPDFATFVQRLGLNQDAN